MCQIKLQEKGNDNDKEVLKNIETYVFGLAETCLSQYKGSP